MHLRASQAHLFFLPLPCPAVPLCTVKMSHFSHSHFTGHGHSNPHEADKNEFGRGVTANQKATIR